jgi:tRNA pseudouridine synthase 2
MSSRSLVLSALKHHAALMMMNLSRPLRSGVARPPCLLLSSSRRRHFASAAAASRNATSGASPPPPTQQPPNQERFVVSARELLRDYQGAQRVRVDQYLADRWPAARALAAGASASRARVQQALKAGLVTVNGTCCTKPSSNLRAGDVVLASLPPPEPLARAEPEAGLDLHVVWEDAHCAVVFKPAGMVVHPSPGHARGTLVNALLHHLGLPAMEAGELMTGNRPRRSTEDGEEDGSEEEEDDGDPFSEEDEEEQAAVAAPPQPLNNHQPPSIVRPGIVHRLDRGTTGLMVVAKTDAAHARLCAQFKARTVGRVYASVVAPLQASGGQSLLTSSGRVATNVARDPRDRLRMAAAPYGSSRGRPAASNFRVVGSARDLSSAERAAAMAGRAGGWGFDSGGGAATAAAAAGTAATTSATPAPLVVEWKLETGRTHQIRVHARHLGWPLLGDDAYGPGNASAARTVVAAVDAAEKRRGRGGSSGKSSGASSSSSAARAAAVKEALDTFGRPALHARHLAFDHPITGERLSFDCGLPEDMLTLLRELGDALGGGGGGGGTEA